MTELEKVKRAKMYMDKLANGINPIDDTMSPDEDIINNVRLSRCFFFVSDVLRQIIEAGGVTPVPISKETKQKKAPFFIPLEKRDAFDFSDIPISATELAARLNKLADNSDMKRMSYKGITSWLTEIGLLSDAARPDGHMTKLPTSNGNKVGISLEERIGSQGMYQVVVYDVQAQHFILDNLDAVMESDCTKTELQGTPWLPSHDECLKDLYQKGVPTGEIAITLKRSTGAIRARLKKLGLVEKSVDG